MTWWAVALIGWAAASLLIALALGGAAGDITRREQAGRLAGPFGPGAPVAGGVDWSPIAEVARRRPSSGSALRRGRGRADSRSRDALRGRRPASGTTGAAQLPTRRSLQGPDSTPRTRSDHRRPGAALPAHRLLSAGRSSMRRRELTVLLRGDRREGSDAHEPAALRRLRATPTPPRGADVATAPALRRSTRTPPPRTPALHRLGGGRRLHRVLALTALPLLALAPVMARSASSFGMGNAIAAEIAAHPDQTDTLIAALDRGRVLAGLTTPVTRPTPPAVAAPVPARGTPADGGSPSSSDPRGTSLSPSVSPGTGAADDRTSSSAPVSTSADPSPLATVPVPTAPRPQPSPDGTPAPTTGPTTPSTPGTPSTPSTPSSAAPTSAAPTSPTSTSAPITPTPSATHTSAPPADPQPTTAAPEPTPTTSAPPLPTTSSTPVRTGAAGSSTSQPAQVP